MTKKIKLSIVGLCLAATLMMPLESASAQNYPAPDGGGKVWKCYYFFWGGKACWWR